jgi:hypothetical protein
VAGDRADFGKEAKHGNVVRQNLRDEFFDPMLLRFPAKTLKQAVTHVVSLIPVLDHKGHLGRSFIDLAVSSNPDNAAPRSCCGDNRRLIDPIHVGKSVSERHRQLPLGPMKAQLDSLRRKALMKPLQAPPITGLDITKVKAAKLTRGDGLRSLNGRYHVR